MEYREILEGIATNPRQANQAYHLFHRYSFGNQMLALGQMYQRGIQPSPINTYKGWAELGRQVREGEKAISLLMPVTMKREVKDKQTGEVQEKVFIPKFIMRNYWFSLAQTDGEEYQLPELPEFNFDLCLKNLNIQKVPFEMTNGNVQGYAIERQLALNPLNKMPHKTFFHEVGHIVLGHTGTEPHTEVLPQSLMEAEAESVALCSISALNLEGAEYSRDYILKWLSGSEIPEKSFQRIFNAVDKILKAGTKNDKNYNKKPKTEFGQNQYFSITDHDGEQTLAVLLMFKRHGNYDYDMALITISESGMNRMTEPVNFKKELLTLEDIKILAGSYVASVVPVDVDITVNVL